MVQHLGATHRKVNELFEELGLPLIPCDGDKWKKKDEEDEEDAEEEEKESAPTESVDNKPTETKADVELSETVRSTTPVTIKFGKVPKSPEIVKKVQTIEKKLDEGIEEPVSMNVSTTVNTDKSSENTDLAIKDAEEDVPKVQQTEETDTVPEPVVEPTPKTDLFNCPLCLYIVDKKVTLRDHLSSTHYQTIILTKFARPGGDLSCTQCGKTYSTPASLARHMGSNHRKLKEITTIHSKVPLITCF